MHQETSLDILKTGNNVFLTGSAGTGKTYVLNQYKFFLKKNNLSYAIVAPTGIAASHLGGSTIHSFFSLGIKEKISDFEIDALLQKKYLWSRYEKLNTLIIDEVSMVSPDIFEAVDKILRAFKFSNKSFGGVQIILSGDFFQLPPITSNKKSEKKYIWQTNLFEESNLKICYLEKNFRQKEGELVSVLEEIRSGNVSEESMNLLRKSYKRKIDNFRPTKLYTHNIDVDRINQEELKKIDEKSNFFEAETKGAKKNYQKIFSSSLLLEKIELKKGAVVIFIKNSTEKGFVNGTLGKIISFDEKTKNPIVEIFSGRKIIVEKMLFEIENEDGKVTASVSQIPLRLAWAITIHKSQGMSLDAAEIDLSKTFEFGQGYVAFSRLKKIEGLRLMGLNKIALEVDKKILEIDEKMRENSLDNKNEFEKKSKKEILEMAKIFVEKNNLKWKGDLDSNEFEKEKKKEEKKIKEKVFSENSTYEKTLELLKKEKTLKEISKKRNLSEDTILKHILKIKKENKNLNLDFLKPEKNILEKVKKAKKILEKKKENLDLDGNLKLKPVFQFLDEKISYDEIKISFIFL